MNLESEKVSLEREAAVATALECLNQGDLAGFADLFDAEVITIDPELGNPVGRDWITGAHGILSRRLPEVRYRLSEFIAAGDRSLALVGLSAAGFGAELCLVLEWSGDRVVTVRAYAEKPLTAGPTPP